MSGIHLVLGGIRSGKSAYAEGLAAELAAEPAGGRPVVYVATGVAVDADMSDRIRRHRDRRPGQWRTVEAPLNPVGALRQVYQTPEPAVPVLLLDSLDGWVSNLLLEYEGMAAAELEARVTGAVRRLASFVQDLSADAVIVSSEVGLSPVAATELGRRFQDALGLANQAMAGAAERVTLVAAGIAVSVKPGASLKSDGC